MDTLALPFEFKSVDAGGVIEGIAAGIGNVDHGGDRIMPGAFAKSLGDRNGESVPMLLFHDMRRPIGAWTSFTERDDGLHAKGRITLATRDGAEAHALAREGALRGLSIGYGAAKERYVGQVRELQELVLHEVSLVAVPMNDRAKVSAVKAITSASDIADMLREAGVSGRRAKLAAGAAWKAIHDSSDEDEAAAEVAAILKASAARIAAKGV